MSNSENEEDILKEYLNNFERYVLEMNASINNYCNFYKIVENNKNLFEKCKNSLTNDEKNDFDSFLGDLLGFNLSFSEIQSKCDEYNQTFQFIIGQYQERIKSLIDQNQELRLKIKSNQDELEEADHVLSKYDDIDQVQHEKPYKDHQFEHVLEQNSALQRENEFLKSQISDQQRTIKSLQDENQNPGDDYKQKYYELYKEHEKKSKEYEKNSEEIQSLRVILKDFEGQGFNGANEDLKQKNSYSNKKIKELKEENEALKRTMKIKEDKLNNEINELKQKFANAEGQEHEIERLIGENKKLENKYNDLQRVGNQQLDELARLNESLYGENNYLKREISDKDKMIQQLTNENSSLKNEILIRDNTIQKLNNEKNSLHKEVENKEKAIQKLINENDSLHKEVKKIDDLTKEIDSLKQQILDKDKEIKKLSDEVKKISDENSNNMNLLSSQKDLNSSLQNSVSDNESKIKDLSQNNRDLFNENDELKKKINKMNKTIKFQIEIINKQMILAKNENELQIALLRRMQDSEIKAIIDTLV